jgi:hypothetical protein
MKWQHDLSAFLYAKLTLWTNEDQNIKIIFLGPINDSFQIAHFLNDSRFMFFPQFKKKCIFSHSYGKSCYFSPTDRLAGVSCFVEIAKNIYKNHCLPYHVACFKFCLYLGQFYQEGNACNNYASCYVASSCCWFWTNQHVPFARNAMYLNGPVFLLHIILCSFLLIFKTWLLSMMLLSLQVSYNECIALAVWSVLCIIFV